jgi:branched-chain amino acid transport system substrate-binding protein
MTLTRHTLTLSIAAALAGATGLAVAQSGETVKVAYIDPLSGSFANIGQNILKTHQHLSQRISGKGNPAGVTFEIVPLDNKASPQETLNSLKAAIDQDIRYVVQGQGSGAAAALIDAVAKHNERNPGKEILFLNYAAVDPDLTNSKCNYWHFRFDADTSMKMEAFTTYMKDEKNIQAVYLINQNYSHGQQVSRFAKEMLARKRPDVKVVGDDLHPLGQVKDFAPYVAKIKASGADSVITGNWGQDLSLLIKAGKDAGLDVTWYTYYAGAAGTPTAIGPGSDGKIKFVYVAHPNIPGDLAKAQAEFKAKFNEDLSTATTYNVYLMLTAAMAKAKSTDPVKVAAALEGLTVKSHSGDVQMRATDHQLQQALYIAKWQKVDAKYKYNVEGTGYTWGQEKMYEAYVASTPTSCQMKRP